MDTDIVIIEHSHRACFEQSNIYIYIYISMISIVCNLSNGFKGFNLRVILVTGTKIAMICGPL